MDQEPNSVSDTSKAAAPTPSPNPFFRWLDRFPLPLLAVMALWLAVAPISPEPHVVEKVRMLLAGTLIRPLDIFDLLLHTVPPVLLMLRLWRQFLGRR